MNSIAVLLLPILLGLGPRGGSLPLSTTIEDFYEPGTQPFGLIDAPIVSRYDCINCHSFDDDNNPNEIVPPHNNWAHSLMAQSARDPVWQAAVAISNQDATGSGETCIRCHAPNGWLEGRSFSGELSELIEDDFDGVNCNFCHRKIDPVWTPENPLEDVDLLNELFKFDSLPTQVGNGRFIVDPRDVRRSPIEDEDSINLHGVDMLVSPHHKEGAFCGECHELSNPVFTKQEDGSYLPNQVGEPHPTGDIHEMMPEQRTYSEWLNSTFASEGVYFEDNRFGGDHPTGIMKSCQDCHMPQTSGAICVFWEQIPAAAPREYVSRHNFVGANNWVLGAVRDLYEDEVTGLTEEGVERARQETEEFLAAASDLDLSKEKNNLKVRLTNYAGHKLPTGFPEGTRIWINVVFYDKKGNMIKEHGAYDFDEATLVSEDTKVYETKLGLTEEMANLTGLPAGESFHLVLNNEIIFDNRIPPMGFTNAAYESIQAAPVGTYSDGSQVLYLDGQHWDDTLYNVPKKATCSEVKVYYQSTTREYAEFLRDELLDLELPEGELNPGQVAYDQWVIQGKSPPVLMDFQEIDFEGEPLLGDLNQDGIVNTIDLLILLSAFGSCDSCPEDLDQSGYVNVLDLLQLLANYGR